METIASVCMVIAMALMLTYGLFLFNNGVYHVTNKGNIFTNNIAFIRRYCFTTRRRVYDKI